MCLVMCGFPSRVKAEKYAETVKVLGLRASVWNSQSEMNEAGCRAAANRKQNDTDPETGKLADVFPFEVQTPIVLVERTGVELETQLEALVEDFGGEFAGT
jgi:hypothetical protein